MGGMFLLGRRMFLLSDEREMKSEKIMVLVKGFWEFCSFFLCPSAGLFFSIIYDPRRKVDNQV